MTIDRRYPIGTYECPALVSAEQRAGWIEEVRMLPSELRQAAIGLTEEQLDTPYRDGGWTLRQVVHHLADSHMNSLIRFKLALTEDTPTIKPYEESLWAELPDGKTADPAVSLGILDGVHYRLNMLLESLTPEQFARPARHPDMGPMTVDAFVQMYAWHSRHHLGHIALAVAKL